MPTPPISVARAISCGLVNLLATPGLGSLMGRRFVSGGAQLLLSSAGFLLITAWIFGFFYRQMSQALEHPTAVSSPDWLWQWGAPIFAAAWLWSLVTSLSLWRDAKTVEAAALKNIPPRLSEVPGEPVQPTH